MRVNRTAVWLAVLCWLAFSMGSVAEDAGGFEALLSDMGTGTGTSESSVAPAVPEPQVDDMAAPEPEASAVSDVAAPAAEAVEPSSDMAAPAPAELPVIEEAAVEAAAVEVEPAEAAVADALAAESEPAAELTAPAAVEEAVAEAVAEPAAEIAAPEEALVEPAADEAAEAVIEAPAEPAVEMAPAADEVAPAAEAAIADAMAEESAPEAEVEPAPAAEEEPVAAAPEGEPVDPGALAAQEEVRRQAMEIQGLKSLELGYKALQAGDFAAAVKNFDEAVVNLPERPANAEARARAKWGNAEASYRMALDVYRRGGNIAEARSGVEKALRLAPDHSAAQSLLKKIEKQEKILAMPLPPAKRPDVLERKKTVDDLLKEGKQYFELADYNRAEALFEAVLIEDEYNVTAMRFLRKIDERRFNISTKERDATVAGMMRQVRDTWNPPVREEVVLPEQVAARGTVQTKSSTQRLQEKMAKIMIPSIEFRQANITDVINFLVEASIAGDEEKIGVNIILNMSVPGEAAAAPAPEPAPLQMGGSMGAGGEMGGEFGDLFGDQGGSAPVSAPAGGSSVRTITLNLRRISLLDAVKYITEVAGLKYRIEDNAVIITPAGVVSGRVITRMYPVQPSILDVIVQKEEEDNSRTGDVIQMGGSQTTMKRGDVKDFFAKAGVPFPVGTSITYNPSISQLIVANTPDNLEIFERILANLNVIPNQIEIEARFVEVGENELEELGLQWILTDNYEFAQKKTGAPLGGRERVQVNADSEGFTKGLRFFSFDGTTASVDPASAVTRGVTQSALGGVMSIASVLTNPELTVILQALSQKGNADLLSAPRVTTRTGVNAQIQVVREIIYPTEFEVTQPTVQSQGDLVTPPTVTPGSFETREVGVILNVTPTVGPDGYTIDLTMVPEVAELVDWIQYGSEFTLESAGTITTTGSSRTFRYNIPQPVFSSRNATTSIVIWDGQTVVMGGLIREELTTIDDKIPLLGDIPVIGRLFRTKGQQSRKTNLLIFVTARLVDPAGKPIHKAEAMAMPGTGAQPVQPETP